MYSWWRWGFRMHGDTSGTIKGLFPLRVHVIPTLIRVVSCSSLASFTVASGPLPIDPCLVLSPSEAHQPQQTLFKSQPTQPKVLSLSLALQAPLPRDTALFRTLSLGEHSSDVTLLPFAQTHTPKCLARKNRGTRRGRTVQRWT